MAKAAAEHIPHHIDTGIVLTKYDHSKGDIEGFTILEAGHPLPDENTILGTQKIIEAVSGLTEKDTVFFLVSGGGSALFEKPAGNRTLADFLDITDQLLKCGADIVEINTIRKHLSAVKGGRFAELCAPAYVYCIALSDILGDRPDSIASGPACADASTSEEAWAVVEKYGLQLTEEMKTQLSCETPKNLTNVTMEITGSVTQLCADAFSLGFRQKVYGILGTPPVGIPLEGGAAVGITQNFSRFFPDQPGEPGSDPPETLQKFRYRGHIVLKGDGGIFNVGCINGQHLG